MNRRKAVPEQPWPTIGRFRFWLQNQKDREPFVYHFGHLFEDRFILMPREDGQPYVTAVEEVHARASAAWEAYEQGEVSLVQQRIAPHFFAYLAIKRRNK